ncbi:MAG TPA: hypothetical protein VN238_06055 [Solirubrobacteraceae bacterium]|nr:hypothetical protein [Solirubrobacteraceae bacterium]
MEKPEPSADTSKSMTLRLSDEQAEDLDLIARVEAVPVTTVIRDALTRAIATCRSDPDFQTRLHQKAAADLEILSPLEPERDGDEGDPTTSAPEQTTGQS